MQHSESIHVDQLGLDIHDHPEWFMSIWWPDFEGVGQKKLIVISSFSSSTRLLLLVLSISNHNRKQLLDFQPHCHSNWRAFGDFSCPSLQKFLANSTLPTAQKPSYIRGATALQFHPPITIRILRSPPISPQSFNIPVDCQPFFILLHPSCLHQPSIKSPTLILLPSLLVYGSPLPLFRYARTHHSQVSAHNLFHKHHLILATSFIPFQNSSLLFF